MNRAQEIHNTAPSRTAGKIMAIKEAVDVGHKNGGIFTYIFKDGSRLRFEPNGAWGPLSAARVIYEATDNKRQAYYQAESRAISVEKSWDTTEFTFSDGSILAFPPGLWFVSERTA